MQKRTMTIEWNDLQTVMMVVRHQTLAAAAKELGINYTTVARRIQRAESALDKRLFERLADGYKPTKAALLIAKYARDMESDAFEMMRKIEGSHDELEGTLVVTAPSAFISHFLAPVIEAYNEACPKVALHLLVESTFYDLSRGKADLAIRASANPGDALMGLRLLKQECAVFASQEVAAKIEANPDDEVHWVLHESHKGVPPNINKEFINHSVRLWCDDMPSMIAAAQAGLGVVKTPIFLGRASGLIQTRLFEPQPYTDVWVVGHRDLWSSKKAIIFRQILRDFCKEKRAQFVS